MISFIKNPEISVILSEKDVSSYIGKQNEFATQGRVKFSKNDIDILRKLEKTEVAVEEDDLPKKKRNRKSSTRISLNDLKQLRKEKYLCDLMEDAEIELPKNEIVERNPVLEERVQRLKAQQANRVYESMVRNVDSRLKQTDPTDSIAFQIKQINRQLIAVAQFIFSVIAGFCFGFIGIELIIGSLDFGFRLLLGIMCALIIALAEIYFLAKKLVEEEDAVELEKNRDTVKVPVSIKKNVSNNVEKVKTN